MVRLGHGLMVLPDKSNSVQEPVAPFYGEIFESHIGYLRLGWLTSANLQAVDKKLAEFAGKKVDALIIDLRSSAANDFAVSADFAKRFSPKGKTLFTLHKAGKPDRVFNSDRDSAYAGLLLADGDTAGGAEVASALRYRQSPGDWAGDCGAQLNIRTCRCRAARFYVWPSPKPSRLMANRYIRKALNQICPSRCR